MVQYARTDTHYLLYIYDCVRAQLLDFNHGQPGLLQSVWNKSKDISLKVSTDLISYIMKMKLTLFQYNSLSSIFSFFYCFHISTFPHT